MVSQQLFALVPGQTQVAKIRYKAWFLRRKWYKQKGHNGGTTDGIRIRDGAEIPTIAPNPNNENKSTATYINVHCGDSETNRGSQGCITIHPNDCDKIWEILQEGETGTVTVSRPQTGESSNSRPICELF